jgi:hypothetical protein
MMSSVWMIRPGLVTGAIFSLGACLLWLLIEQDLSAGALLRSAAWGFIAWPVYVILWVAVCHGEEFENSQALASAEGAGGDRALYTAAARSCARGDIGCRVPGPGYRRGRPGYFQLKGGRTVKNRWLTGPVRCGFWLSIRTPCCCADLGVRDTQSLQDRHLLPLWSTRSPPAYSRNFRINDLIEEVLSR